MDKTRKKLSKNFKANKGYSKLFLFGFILLAVLTILFSYISNRNQIQISSSAAETVCSTPGGCGGACNPNQNMGCGFGGCRHWEYCADENKDGVYSCHWKTQADGFAKPEDYSGACREKASQTSSGNTQPSPTKTSPNVTSPPAKTICNNPEGCGGNCYPKTNLGCGYGGCRSWEYCADENNDGLYSCYDTTNLGKKEPDYNLACGPDMNPIADPTSEPTVTPTTSPNSTITPTIPISTSTPIPSETPIPTQLVTATPTNIPQPTKTIPPDSPTSDGKFDVSKLCIPVEMNGSHDEKLDVAVIPVGFSQSQLQNGFYDRIQGILGNFRRTNLGEYENEIMKKMNWQIINPLHPDFTAEMSSPTNPEDIEEEADILLRLGVEAKYCSRDIFIVLLNSNRGGGRAITGIGAMVWNGSIDYDGGVGFIHEWAHVTGFLADEVPSTNNDNGFNCTRNPSASGLPADPCPQRNPGGSVTAGSFYCPSGTLDTAFDKPCPAWDCNVQECSDLEKRILEGTGCYPRCGTFGSFRPAANSIMSNPWDEVDGTIFNGPSLLFLVNVLKQFN